jgi:hypothetical protein
MMRAINCVIQECCAVTNEFKVIFAVQSMAEQSKLAMSLANKLNETNGVDARVIRDGVEAQDTGTIVSIILTAPALLAAINAIASWATRQNQSSVVIQKSDGTVIVRNMKSEDVPETIQALSKTIQ